MNPLFRIDPLTVGDQHNPWVNCRGQVRATRDDARRAIFRYIDTWYNRERRHATLAYVSPAVYEERLQRAA
ncbi:MAG TPA: IS3 family transposase [Acidobacteriaceae bacterium]|nr:IS3 family transposase [Acidobacteriaceae bacterium]